MLLTTVDKAPFLASFPKAPTNGTWISAVQNAGNLTDTRTFACPAIAGTALSFAVDCDEAIAAGDPDPTAHYSLTFSSVTNPKDPAITFHINVPQGLGPVSERFTFKSA
jgi:hypothetical protein